MDRVETSKILSYIKTAYPSSFKDMKREEMENILSMWQYKFSKTPADLVFFAVEELVASKRFVPTVSDVCEHLVGMYWDNLIYVSGIKRNSVFLTEEQKQKVFYIDKHLEGFARMSDQNALNVANETKLLGGG